MSKFIIKKSFLPKNIKKDNQLELFYHLNRNKLEKNDPLRYLNSKSNLKGSNYDENYRLI